MTTTPLTDELRQIIEGWTLPYGVEVGLEKAISEIKSLESSLSEAKALLEECEEYINKRTVISGNLGMRRELKAKLTDFNKVNDTAANKEVNDE